MQGERQAFTVAHLFLLGFIGDKLLLLLDNFKFLLVGGNTLCFLDLQLCLADL